MTDEALCQVLRLIAATGRAKTINVIPPVYITSTLLGHKGVIVESLIGNEDIVQ
jgi:hypothetical protein